LTPCANAIDFSTKDCFDSDVVDVYFINGILNNEAEAAASAAKLQQVMDGVLAGKFDINCIYNPTDGPVVDLECFDLVAQAALNIGQGVRFLAARSGQIIADAKSKIDDFISKV